MLNSYFSRIPDLADLRSGFFIWGLVRNSERNMQNLEYVKYPENPEFPNLKTENPPYPKICVLTAF